MKMYSEFPLARSRQIVGDVVAVVAVILGIVVAVAVHRGIQVLAEVGMKVEGAGRSFTSTMSGAAKVINGIPLVGGKARAPFDGASAAGRTLTDAGQSEQGFIAVLANVLALLVVAIVLYFVIRYWVIRRIRFATRATRMASVARAEGGLDLLAVRAMATADPRLVLAISPTVVAEWRRGERQAITRLAALELRDAGVRLRG